LSYYNNIDSSNIKDNYFSDNFGDKFFDYKNAKKIGFIREDIERNRQLLNEKERSIILAALIYAMDRIANTVGHFDAYIKKPIAEKKLELRIVKPLNNLNCKIYREDANSLASKLKVDVTYIDPPYNSRQYSRFYPVYETLVKWDKPDLHGVALKPEPENMSAYCTVKAKASFEDLVQKLNSKYIVVSYNNTYKSKSSSSENKIKLEEIEGILAKKGQTKVYEAAHKCFNSGKTEFDDHKEFLFLTKVSG
jgi:adenine-specific DNA-methyltransferase